jgi:hypothetical protein
MAIQGISPLLVETCAELVGPDARSPRLVAVRYGVSPWAVYKRRRRLEKALGVLLPRKHKVGRRPVSPQRAGAPLASRPAGS